jgi:outer membrane lipoprotein SlyB
MKQTSNYPLLMASGVAALAGLLVVSAALTGALPALAARQQAAAAAESKSCASCGVVAGISKRGFYDITVRMDDGRVITLSQDEAPSVGLGDRVRVNGGVLVRG